MFAVMRRDRTFDFDFKRTDFLENPQYLVKMWLTDKLCPSWPPGYVNSERFERVSKQCLSIVNKSMPITIVLNVIYVLTTGVC